MLPEKRSRVQKSTRRFVTSVPTYIDIPMPRIPGGCISIKASPSEYLWKSIGIRFFARKVWESIGRQLPSRFNLHYSYCILLDDRRWYTHFLVKESEPVARGVFCYVIRSEVHWIFIPFWINDKSPEDRSVPINDFTVVQRRHSHLEVRGKKHLIRNHHAKNVIRFSRTSEA